MSAAQAIDDLLSSKNEKAMKEWLDKVHATPVDVKTPAAGGGGGFVGAAGAAGAETVNTHTTGWEARRFQFGTLDSPTISGLDKVAAAQGKTLEVQKSQLQVLQATLEVIRGLGGGQWVVNEVGVDG